MAVPARQIPPHAETRRGVEWLTSGVPVTYDEAIRVMDTRVSAIIDSHAPETVWLLEHPSLYTSGTSGKDSDLLDPRFPTFAT